MLNFGDEDDFIDKIETCCFKTTELLKDIFTNDNAYYINEFHHTSDMISLNIIDDIYVPSFLILEINDIAETGNHYISVIYTTHKTYVIQSFRFRYSYIVSYYNSLENLLLYCQQMINNYDPKLKCIMNLHITKL